MLDTLDIRYSNYNNLRLFSFVIAVHLLCFFLIMPHSWQKPLPKVTSKIAIRTVKLTPQMQKTSTQKHEVTASVIALAEPRVEPVVETEITQAPPVQKENSETVAKAPIEEPALHQETIQSEPKAPPAVKSEPKKQPVLKSKAPEKKVTKTPDKPITKPQTKPIAKQTQQKQNQQKTNQEKIKQEKLNQEKPNQQKQNQIKQDQIKQDQAKKAAQIKAAEAKEAEAKAIQAKQNALLQEALTSLNKAQSIEQKKQAVSSSSVSQSSQNAKQIQTLASESLVCIESENEVLVGKEKTYYDELVQRLKLHLRLPDHGNVKIRLTLNRLGKVTHVECTQSKSAKNSAYLKKTISTIPFPSFGQNFTGEKEHTFQLHFANELSY